MPLIHIALRVARSAASVEDPVEAHRALIDAEGAVLFGKVGRPMGKTTIAAVNAQAESDIPTYLFLASPRAMRMSVYRGRIASVTQGLPPGGEHLVPAYYEAARLTKRIKSWFRLTELHGDEVNTLRQLVNANSGKPLMSLLAASRTSMFVVSPKPGARID